jgi:plasmid replication initiation protein
MTNNFTQERCNNDYKERFPRESTNAYFKTQQGIFKSFSPNKKALKNEIHLINTVYNMTRFLNLKDTYF